jgi:hypothetical protein
MRDREASRPLAELALFNPAFLGLIVIEAARDYRAVTGAHMPLELAYLVPPLVLHEETRGQLPKATSARLSGWMESHPIIAAEYPTRAQKTVPVVRDAIAYLLAGGSAELREGGLAVRVPTVHPELFTAEGMSVLRKAALVGRWFGKSGATSTIFGLMGVRP